MGSVAGSGEIQRQAHGPADVRTSAATGPGYREQVVISIFCWLRRTMKTMSEATACSHQQKYPLMYFADERTKNTRWSRHL